MNITSVSNLADFSKYATDSASAAKENRNAAFEDFYQAAKNMVNQTNSYTSAAKEAETSYALGLTNNPQDVQVAQQKADISLQYTVAVRNGVLDAYKEIMNLQF
ncbi:MAG TPA: flagellar hook-basal body complex protein FliE [Mobilitalea sp.]|nr:flagellar hook-basal body complex protein FliE [Mobilitalea sp.]